MTSAAEHAKLAALGWLATVTTSLAFLPALSQQRCVLIGAALSAAMVLVGAGLRRLGCRPVVVLVLQLLSTIELLVVTYGHGRDYLVFPTTKTFSVFRHQVETGLEVANKYAAPAPASVGLLLLVVLFIAVVACFVDFLAMGLRRAPLAGLPLLALYTVPVAALPDGVPFYCFVPGALSYIALLMSDERNRLSRWGRLVSRTSTETNVGVMDTSGLVASGRRITTLAVLAAVFLPLFVPVLSTTLWGSGAGLGGGSGTQLTFGDPMVSLATSLRRPRPVDLMTVSGDIPPEYLRMAVLDRPGPNAWTSSARSPGNDLLPLQDIPARPPGMSPSVPTSPHSMTVELTGEFPADSAWLPVPYLARSVDVGPDWRYVPPDQTVTALKELAISSLGPYDVAYQTVTPTAEQLQSAGSAPADIRQRYGDVPAGLPSVVTATARQVTAGAANNYERAVDLQSFFRDPHEFHYDVNAGYGYGYRAMAAFLQQRRGFCQHFAATMAMMARTLGIPSRVVVGFLQPDRTTGPSSYVFTSQDVHSWPELYFQGVGWVRFEPTQGVGAPFPQWADANSGPTSQPSVTVPTSPGVVSATKQQRPTAAPTQVAGTTGGPGGGSNGSVPSKAWLIPLAALAVALVPALIRLAVRRNRLGGPVDAAAAAEAAWLELRDSVRDLRLPWSGSMTPRARERSIAPLVGSDSEARTALQRLAKCVEQARYATTVFEGNEPAADASTVMAAISRRTDGARRLRAVLWPASLLPDARAAWSRVRRSAP